MPRRTSKFVVQSVLMAAVPLGPFDTRQWWDEGRVLLGKFTSLSMAAAAVAARKGNMVP